MKPFKKRGGLSRLEQAYMERWHKEMQAAQWPNFDHVSVMHDLPGIFAVGKSGKRVARTFIHAPAGLHTALDARVLAAEFDVILSELHEAVA